MLRCFTLDYLLDWRQKQCSSHCEAQDCPSPKVFSGQEGQVDLAPLLPQRTYRGPRSTPTPGPVCQGTGLVSIHLGPLQLPFFSNSWPAATLTATQKHWKGGCAAQGTQASPKVQSKPNCIQNNAGATQHTVKQTIRAHQPHQSQSCANMVFRYLHHLKSPSCSLTTPTYSLLSC